MDREKVIKGLECCAFSKRGDKCEQCPYFSGCETEYGAFVELAHDALALLKAQEPITGETSDGYHTFNELYHHRAVLFSVIVANYPDRAWKSKKHHDGTMYDNMFIVGIDTPDGQATYHYDIDPYWDMFKCRVLDNAPEWDGHTPAQAIERIGKLKAQEPRVMTWEEAQDNVQDGPFIIFEVRDSTGSEVDFGVLAGDFYEMSEGSVLTVADFWMLKDEYGKRFRLWTSRPTDEQRQAVKWE